MLAVQALGAEGVQIGTRFALTAESSASEVFKTYCLNLEEGDTRLLLKKLAPTRLVKGRFLDEVARARFLDEVARAEDAGATPEELRTLLGKGRAKLGIFEGNLEEGELEIGQAASLLKGKGIQTVAEVMKELAEAYGQRLALLQSRAGF